MKRLRSVLSNTGMIARNNPPLHKGKRFALSREGREDPTQPGRLATSGSDCVVDLRTSREAEPEDLAAYVVELEAEIEKLRPES